MRSHDGRDRNKHIKHQTNKQHVKQKRFKKEHIYHRRFVLSDDQLFAFEIYWNKRFMTQINSIKA